MDRPKPLTANAGQDAAYLGMRVNLIGENGHIDALLLPRVAEGKYRFSQAGSGFLSIEALGGQWYLCCDAATCFVGAQSVDCRQTPLALRQMYFLRNAGRQYILYAETITKASSVFRNYRARYNVPIRFGRDNTNDIVSSNGFVSHHHAVFRLTERGWEVQDLESANGVYVNHCRVRGTAALKLGDVVYLMGPRVIVGTDFLSICSGDTKMYVSPSVLPVLDPPAATWALPPVPPRRAVQPRPPQPLFHGVAGHRSGCAAHAHELGQDAAGAAHGFVGRHGRPLHHDGQLQHGPHLAGLPLPHPALHRKGAQGI